MGQLLSVNELAKYLNVSLKVLALFREAEDFPKQRIGKYWSKPQIDLWLLGDTQPSAGNGVTVDEFLKEVV